MDRLVGEGRSCLVELWSSGAEHTKLIQVLHAHQTSSGDGGNSGKIILWTSTQSQSTGKSAAYWSGSHAHQCMNSYLSSNCLLFDPKGRLVGTIMHPEKEVRHSERVQITTRSMLLQQALPTTEAQAQQVLAATTQAATGGNAYWGTSEPC
eukprot:2139425-Amphidinium_carterae.1